MPKLTRQQSAARKMNLLKMDMISMLDETPERFNLPYDPNTPINEAVHEIINTIRQFMDQSHRIATLINLYYLGELLSVTINPQQLWKNYLQGNALSNNRRYYRAATRLYELFWKEPEQIYRTKFLSMYYIAGMTNEDYNNNFLPYVKSLSLSSEDFTF